MHIIPFGKNQGLAGETPQALTQGVEPAFDMCRLAFGFADHVMTAKLENMPVSLPMVAEGEAMHISVGQSPPQTDGAGFRAIAHPEGNHLSGATTQCQPQPKFLHLVADKRLQLIQFQHIIPLGRLFSDPVSQLAIHRSQRLPKDELDPSQVHALTYGPLHLTAQCFCITRLSQQRAILATVFAMIFLCAFVVMAVFDHFPLPYLGHGCIIIVFIMGVLCKLTWSFVLQNLFYFIGQVVTTTASYTLLKL